MVIIIGVIGVIGLMFLILAFIIFPEDHNISIISVIIFGICLIIIVLLTRYTNSISAEKIWEQTWKTNIIALKDNSNVEGKFTSSIFISSGYINESLYYYCMESTTEGKHIIKIPSDNTYIIETNEKEPTIIKKTEVYVDKRRTFWLLEEQNVAEKYIIYVPKGTIDTTYKIDLQ